jgi:hypothetical protein
MTDVGKVVKGTILLPPDVNLPKGTPVRVELIETLTLAERLKDFIGIVDDIPADWAPSSTITTSTGRPKSESTVRGHALLSGFIESE